VIVRYFNNQNERDPMNGKAIVDGAMLAALLDERRKEPPFIAKLRGENGFQLVCGIGDGFCCVEHMRSNGHVPYLMAISAHPPMKSGDVEFLTADTPTPIPARYILSFDEFKQIALYFLETGERSGAVRWEEI
jgi:Immunity protein Imm1